jgi:hypothetical protein
MPKNAKPARPALPERLQRSLEQRRAAADQRVVKPAPRAPQSHQAPRHQKRG